MSLRRSQDETKVSKLPSSALQTSFLHWQEIPHTELRPNLIVGVSLHTGTEKGDPQSVEDPRHDSPPSLMLTSQEKREGQKPVQTFLLVRGSLD